MRVLAINPGGGSTRVALYEEEQPLFQQELLHAGAAVDAETPFEEQERLRHESILRALREAGVDVRRLDAAVGRGGPYRPMPGGTWLVTPALLGDIRAGRVMAEHPSNLGAPLAARFAAEAGVSAYVVDPVCVDELWPVARLTGLPDFPRQSLFHALNIKAVARRHAAERGRPLEALRLVVAHLGSGISVALLVKGRAVDVNNSADEGPFSTRRAGSLPATALLRWASSPGFELGPARRRLMSRAGLLAHLGTADLAQAWERARSGDERAALVLDALAYRVATEIGARAAAAEGRLDAILLTGGMARARDWLEGVIRRVSWIAPVHVYPGEEEMRALVEGALRVLRGQERARRYPEDLPEP